MSHFTNMTSMTDFLIAANNVTSGFLAYSMVVMCWVSLFFVGMAYGRAKAITFSSFITGLVILFLNNLGLVPFWMMIADLFLFSIGAGMILISKRI